MSETALAEVPTEVQILEPVAEVPANSLSLVLSQAGRITSAVAREMAARSAEARRQRLAERMARLAEAEERPPDPQDPAYLAVRISQARAQIDRLTELTSKCSDPKACEQFARAVREWSEIERILSGRPLPGQRQPGPEKPPKRGPIEPV